VTLAFLILFQTVAATPTPTPAPTPKRTPVVATPGRTLSDVARERKLQQARGEAPRPGLLTVAPSGGGIGARGTEPSPKPADAAAAVPPAGHQPVVFVNSAEHNDMVSGNGQVRVSGSVRNAGEAPACDVVLTVRLYDEKGVYLASGSGRIDEPLLRPGASSSFGFLVQVPPGVAGSRKQKSLGYGTTGGGVSLEGSWRTLGRAEAEVALGGGACPGERPPAETPKEDPR